MSVLAGIHDARRPPTADAEARLAAGLGGDGGPAVTALTGPLALAWSTSGTGSDPPSAVVAGFLADMEAYADRAGLDPGLPAPTLVASAWRNEGDDALARLRGEFVLVLWDPARATGVVATDHAGLRPLVWNAADGRTLFASEVRHLLRLVDRRPSPDAAGVAQWVGLGAISSGGTLYQDVSRLRAAHLLPLGDDAPCPRPYWRPVYAVPRSITRADAAEQIRAALTTAVRRRCSPDGNTAVMMSGGLDSGTIAGLAVRALAPDRIPRRSYSARFPHHPTVDESAYVDRLSDAYRLENLSIVVEGGSVIGGALDYLDHWALPPVSPNVFFWGPLLRRAAADGVAELLDGEGGDEMFGASVPLLADYLRRGRPLRAWRLLDRAPSRNETGLTARSKRAAIRRFGLEAALPWGVERALRPVRRAPRPGTPGWLRPATRDLVFATDGSHEYKRLRGPRWWSNLVEATFTGAAPAMGAGHVQRRAAWAGLEARHPMLDVDVLEAVLALPPELMFDRDTRPLLRIAAAGVVPDEVRLRRHKSPFDAIFHDLLAGPDLPTVHRLLARGGAAVGEYVDLPAMREALLERPPPANRRDWAFTVWRLLGAECFLLAQADCELPRRLAEEAGIAPTAVRFVHRTPDSPVPS